MSRGGRGGFGRGGARGGGGFGGGPFGHDDIKPDYSVTELFPPVAPPIQSSLTKEERAIVARFRSHREKIHLGPMYTVLGRRRDMEDPFTDVQRYSAKYQRAVRRTPKLDARPYVYEFFPAELHATIGKDQVGTTKKRLMFQALDELDPFEDLVAGEDEEGVENEEGGKDGDGDEDKAEGEDEEPPDDLSDDENDDYNAETYFDNGEDLGDDYGDDADDGGYF